MILTKVKERYREKIEIYKLLEMKSESVKSSLRGNELDKPDDKAKEEITYKNVYDYLKEWLSSPFFVLHFCRVGIMFWCLFLPSYLSALLLVW